MGSVLTCYHENDKSEILRIQTYMDHGWQKLILFNFNLDHSYIVIWLRFIVLIQINTHT